MSQLELIKGIYQQMLLAATAKQNEIALLTDINAQLRQAYTDRTVELGLLVQIRDLDAKILAELKEIEREEFGPKSLDISFGTPTT